MIEGDYFDSQLLVVGFSDDLSNEWLVQKLLNPIDKTLITELLVAYM